jgi:hypothetical protein
VDEALIGLTCVYENDRLPEAVSLDWGLFLPDAGEVTATATDPFGASQTVLTPTDSTLSWENRLSGFKVPVIRPVPVVPPHLPVLSIALALISAATLAMAARGTRHPPLKGLGAACMALAIVSYPFVRTPFRPLGSGPFKPTREEARAVVDGLLSNIYRSFDQREEGAVYDRLAMTVSGDQLTEIYLQSRKALELEDRGGARGRVDDVDVRDVRDVTRQEDGAFLVDAEWTVGGSVSHFGHTHHRRNGYRAVIRIAPEGDTWKIRRITVLDERRLL